MRVNDLVSKSSSKLHKKITKKTRRKDVCLYDVYKLRVTLSSDWSIPMKKLLLLLFLYLLYFPQLQASTGVTNDVNDESKTIKELHESIKGLKIEKRDLTEKWKELSKENGKITDFIRQELTPDEEKIIEDILSLYFSQRDALEEELKKISLTLTDAQGVKEEIIKLKLDLYKSLTPYVKVEKLKDYVAYIKNNLEIVIEERNLKEDIYRKEEILWRKVEAVKEKIEANNKMLDEKIRQLIKEKVGEKIQKLLDNPNFVSLENAKKKLVFEATLKKIQEKKESLRKIYDQTTFVEKKIEIYSVVEEKLKEYIAKY